MSFLCIIFYIYIYIYIDTQTDSYAHTHIHTAPSAGAVQYTDCTSAWEYPPPNECPGYDTKQSDGEVPLMLELWEMRSTPSLASLPGPLWLGVVAPDRVLSMAK